MEIKYLPLNKCLFRHGNLGPPKVSSQPRRSWTLSAIIMEYSYSAAEVAAPHRCTHYIMEGLVMDFLNRSQGIELVLYCTTPISHLLHPSNTLWRFSQLLYLPVENMGYAEAKQSLESYYSEIFG